MVILVRVPTRLLVIRRRTPELKKSRSFVKIRRYIHTIRLSLLYMRAYIQRHDKRRIVLVHIYIGFEINEI